MIRWAGGSGPGERILRKMDEIKDIYNREIYRPFVEFCSAHGYRTMRDLGCYDFRLLSRREDFSPMLITRIKAVYAAYKRQEEEKKTAEAAPKRRSPAPISPVMETQLLLQLRDYLRRNSSRLVTLEELYRETGGRLKRTRITKLLADAPWCCQVDRTRFFWKAEAREAAYPLPARSEEAPLLAVE